MPGDVEYHVVMVAATPEQELRNLIDEYRSQCLWFLREDYYPTTPSEREQVLRTIARHGDLEAFRRAGNLQTWLSRRFNDMSADC